jgi:hypothetical protein
MPISDKRLLQLAIDALENKRQAIDDELGQLRSRLGVRSDASEGDSQGTGKRRRRRRRMTPEQKRLISERMKARWAQRRKAGR